ncbi:hypothetical protein [Amycolatopsis sp. NPDC059657]|uniref:hypothetical protein n=1 Tax=Amycolatopsis sp. NPDC059657 TaxID=3346899 RepID=UPI00366E3DE0
MTDSERAAWLVLGKLGYLNGTARPRGGDPVVVVPLQAPLEDGDPVNTVVLSWDELGEVRLRAGSVDGAHRAEASADGAEIFGDMLPGQALRVIAAAVSTEDGLRQPIVPLCYVSAVFEDGRYLAHLYAQIRFLAEDACFIRLTPEPVAVTGPDDLGWLDEFLDRHAGESLFLNNHQKYYRKCFAGKELEYKYTLEPPVDIWTLTVELYRRLRAGALSGYLMEYRDEFQAWDYFNHLFQVTAPEADRGYVSFVPTTDGANLVKRKWFESDAFERRESHTYGVRPAAGFDAYVRDELGVSATRLPSFRRVRYDVNFESTRTGHVYGIFFDHVSLIEAPEMVLNQCEVEYLRSRTVLEPDESAVLKEIAEIATWLEGFLREHGLTDERGYYSKMTFLLDSVAARPELAIEVS